MHSYAAVTRRFWTLEDTLVGYMFNDLIWCGQEEKDRGRIHHDLRERERVMIPLFTLFPKKLKEQLFQWAPSHHSKAPDEERGHNMTGSGSVVGHRCNVWVSA